MVAGTGNSCWSRSVSGTYTVTSINPGAGCSLAMSGPVTVSGTPTIGGTISPASTEVYSSSASNFNLSLSGQTGVF
ncbi:MAG: hypothetical protein IPJ20_23475 [Flammeovirgaceae bacterium]|nr:hypothetical protein [Flammeovirgaceae bacterium]